MTPSRHNRDLHHHTITPEYPIIDLRLPATVFDVYPTHLGTRTKSSCSWDEPLRPSMTACPKLSSTFHNQMVTTKDNRGSQGLNSYLWYLDPHLVAGNTLIHYALRYPQAELRTTLATAFAPFCLGTGYVRTLNRPDPTIAGFYRSGGRAGDMGW